MKRRIKEMLNKNSNLNVGSSITSARGITLIALVITIIILIILSGITINLTVGDNGIFKKAEISKIETKRSQIREFLDLKLLEEKTMDFEADNKTIIERTRENVIRNRKNLEKLGKEIEIKEIQEENGEIFFYVIVDKDIFKVSLDGTKYIGQQNDEEIELQTGKITFKYTPSDWTNGDVEVEIEGNTTEYILQYKTEETGESGEVANWTNYISTITLTRNQDIYVRVVDSIGQTSETYATGTVKNIDKTPPSKTIVDLNGYTSGTWTTEDITQSFSATDSESGVSYYQYSTDGVNVEGNVSNPWIISWNEECDFYIRAVDKVGNVGEWSDKYTIKRHTLATEVTLNKTSTTIYTGNTEILTATVTPSNTTDQSITWTSSDESVATVAINGTVTAIAPGEATITATTRDGSNKSASCIVTVNGVGSTWSYDYTGEVQTLVVPCDGTYQLVLSGSQGGSSSSYTGGKGGEVTTFVTFTKGDILQIYVGGQDGWNGGGIAKVTNGGDGTHIEIGGAKIAVAGGGGGATTKKAGGAGGSSITATSTATSTASGTAGGGGGYYSGSFGRYSTGTCTSTSWTYKGEDDVDEMGNVTKRWYCNSCNNIIHLASSYTSYSGTCGATITTNTASKGGSSWVDTSKCSSTTYTSGAQEGTGTVVITLTSI